MTHPRSITWRTAALAALALSPALLPLYLVMVYGVDIPFWDEWAGDIAGMFVKVHQHTFSLRDLLALHNEHRIVIPRVIYLLLGLLTHWNLRAEMIVTWLVIVATSAAVLRLMLGTLRCEGVAGGSQSDERIDSRTLWLWLLCNILIFTPMQWENLLWGMGLANVLPAMFVMLSIIAASSRWPLNRRLIAVILFNTAATYSQGDGVLAWPLTGVMLAWSGSWTELKSKRLALAIFTAAFVMNVVLYMIGYVQPEHGGAHPYSLQPSLVIPYFFSFMSSGFALTMRYNALDVAAVLTALMLALLLVAHAFQIHAHRRGDLSLCGRMLAWLGVSWFAVLSGVMTSLSRAGFGSEQALTPRYVSFSLYLPVGLIALVVLMSDDLMRRRGAWRVNADPPRLGAQGRLAIQLPPVLAFALVLLVIMGLPSTFIDMGKFVLLRRYGKAAVLLSAVAPDISMLERAALKPSGDVLAYAPLLSAMGYLRPPLLRSNIATELPSGRNMPFTGKADSIWRTTTDSITFSGWVDFRGYLRRSGTVVISYDDLAMRPVILAVGELGVVRASGTGEVQQPEHAASGWIATIPLSRLPADPAKLTVRAWVLDIDSGLIAPIEGVLTVDRRP